jgi:DNA polymerase III subunit gamma/tau
MAFLVTARKYRPQRFDEVVGQEHITTTLINSLKSGRVAHAYLFTGPRGVGKTTSARILAKSLNCLNPQDYEPCNKCEMCLSIQSSQLMDIIEIDAASNRGIDEIRMLRESVKYSPTKGKYKVYIIDEVHMLTKDSFNAFLKTLEEPPSHTVFIFATTDIQKVPSTIISRCQRYDFRRINLNIIKTLLQEIADKEGITIDDKTLTIIAKKADGGLRDAESFFDQAVAFCGDRVDYETVVKILNLIDDDVYFKISDSILQKDYSTPFSVAKLNYDNGWNFIDFTEGLIEHFRNIMTVIVSGTTDFIETSETYKKAYLNYEKSFTESDLLRILSYLNNLQSELRFSQNHRLKIEVALCHIIGLERSISISSLLSNIDSDEPELKPTQVSKQTLKKEEAKISSINENHGIYQSSTNIKQENLEIESIKSVQKKTIKEPDSLFNFENVVKKWEGFVKSINSEKALVLGPMVRKLSPIGVDRNSINVQFGDDSGKVMYSTHQEYFDKKITEHFGKKFQLNFVEGSYSPSFSSGNIDSINNFSSKIQFDKSSDDDPLIIAIKDELGGEEFN